MADFLPLPLDGLEVVIPDELTEFGELLEDRRNLSNPAVGPSVYSAEKSLKKDHTETLDDLKLTIGASVGGRFSVNAYNDDSDRDPDGIVEPSQERAFLKYELGAQGRVSASGELAGGVKFGLDFSAEDNLRLLQYRVHEPDEKLGAAVKRDLKSYRFAFRARDIKKLEGGEALAVIALGKLAFKAELSWSDVLSSTVTALDRALDQEGVAAFDVNMGARVSFDFSAEDDYRLVFAPGKAKGDIAIDVGKNRQNRIGTHLGLSVEVGFSHPADLSKAVQAYLSGRLGREDISEELDQIEQAASFEELDPSTRKVVEELATRFLDLDPEAELAAIWNEVKEKVSGLDGGLRAEVEKALKTKLTAAFTFAYSRVKTHQTLLSCEIPSGDLDDLLPDLLTGKLTDLLTELGKPGARENGFLLHHYLDTRTVAKTRSFGFALSLGPIRAAGTSQVKSEWTEETNIHQRRRLAFESRASYRGQWGTESYEYVFELPAAMKRFLSSPRVSDFETACNMAWYWEEKRLSHATVCAALDLATVWGVLAEDDTTDALVEILAKARRKKARLEVELRIDGPGMTTLLHIGDEDFEATWIRGLAAALPPVRENRKKGGFDPGMRGGIGERIAAYEGAARFAFEQGKKGSGVDISAIVGRVEYRPDATPLLRAIDLGSRSAVTSQAMAGVVAARLPWSLTELWQAGSTASHDRPFQLSRRLYEGALSTLRNGSLGKIGIETAFRSAQKVVQAKPYNSRLVGYVVSSLLRNRAVSVEASMTVAVVGEDGEDESVIVLAG